MQPALRAGQSRRFCALALANRGQSQSPSTQKPLPRPRPIRGQVLNGLATPSRFGCLFVVAACPTGRLGTPLLTLACLVLDCLGTGSLITGFASTPPKKKAAGLISIKTACFGSWIGSRGLKGCRVFKAFRERLLTRVFGLTKAMAGRRA